MPVTGIRKILANLSGNGLSSYDRDLWRTATQAHLKHKAKSSRVNSFKILPVWTLPENVSLARNLY